MERITLKFDQLPEEDKKWFRAAGIKPDLKNITPRDYSFQLEKAYNIIRRNEKKREEEAEKRRRSRRYALTEDEAEAQFDDDWAASLYDLEPPPEGY